MGLMADFAQHVRQLLQPASRAKALNIGYMFKGLRVWLATPVNYYCAGGWGRPGSGLVLTRGRALRSTACLCEAAPVVPPRLTALPVRDRVLHAAKLRTTLSCSEPRPEQLQLPSAPAGGAGPALAGGPGFT